MHRSQHCERAVGIRLRCLLAKFVFCHVTLLMCRVVLLTSLSAAGSNMMSRAGIAQSAERSSAAPQVPVSHPTNVCLQICGREWFGCNTGHQEVSGCHAERESWGKMKDIGLCQMRIRLPTLALKLRNVTRSPKQGH